MNKEEPERPEQALPRKEGQGGSAQDAPCQGAASVQELTSRLEEADREREQFKRLLQRVQADFSNFRKRADEERDEYRQQANAGLLLKLLPVLDEFDMALEQVPWAEPRDEAVSPSADATWLEGVRLIRRKIASMLESEGVVPIDALDKQFDPWEHEAVAYREAEGEPEGKVLAVLRVGYKLHGRVLRPAQVAVAKAVSSEERKSNSGDQEECKDA